MNCYERGNTRLLLTRIPFYKDVILSSFECDSCHFKNNDIQPAQGVELYGILINVHIITNEDLNRQFVKSSYEIIRIKELDFEQAPRGENGVLTTIEGRFEKNSNNMNSINKYYILGFLSSIIENINKTIKQIEETIAEIRQNRKENATDDDNNDEKNILQFDQQKDKLVEFVTRVESFKSLSETFHFEIDDLSGNSFIENPKAPHRDEQMTTKQYRRTPEQNSLLGITDEEKFITNNESKEEKPDSIQDEVLTFGEKSS